MINFKDINKYYKADNENFHVLKNINLSIKEGEFVAVMGKSGSGKSTLIKILGLLDDDYTGIYTFINQDVKQLSDNKKCEFRNQTIGFVFQNFNLIKRLTAIENIELPLLYNNNANARKRAVELLRNVGLEEKANKYPDELSGGQQQRISIARALANSPKLIIADEPTGALDSKTSKEIMELFKDLNDKGSTIVMVTHDINVAKYGSRIIEIEDGCIKGLGCENG